MMRPVPTASLCCAIFVFLAAVACSSREPIRIVNDLDFEVALVRCESKSITSHETYIPPGAVRSVKSGDTCPVQAADRCALIAKCPGRYIGCLAIPADSERAEVTLRVSQADPTVSFRTCDGVE